MSLFKGIIFHGMGEFSGFLSALALRVANNALSDQSGKQQLGLQGTEYDEGMAEEIDISMKGNIDDFLYATGYHDAEYPWDKSVITENMTPVTLEYSKVKTDERFFNIGQQEMVINSVNYSFIRGRSPLWIYQDSGVIKGFLWGKSDEEIDYVLRMHRLKMKTTEWER